MEQTKHNFFKNYRTIISRGNELKPTELRANGTYAVAYKEDGITDTQWGIIVLEDGKIKYCYNLLAKDIWMGFPIEEKVTIDMHIFKATAQEEEMADLYMETIQDEKAFNTLAEERLSLQIELDAIKRTTWYNIGKSLHMV